MTRQLELVYLLLREMIKVAEPRVGETCTFVQIPMSPGLWDMLQEFARNEPDPATLQLLGLVNANAELAALNGELVDLNRELADENLRLRTAILEELSSSCTCDPAYRDRSLQDPQCRFCDQGHLRDALAANWQQTENGSDQSR